MSAENALRKAARTAQYEACKGAVDPAKAVVWAQLAEMLHRLADRRDAADFTEPDDKAAMTAAHGVWISRENALAIQQILTWIVNDDGEANRLEAVLNEALA